MTATAAALELIDTPNLSTAAEIARELDDALPDDQLSALEISHEIKDLNLQTLAEMVLETADHMDNNEAEEFLESWKLMVEFAQGVSARGVAA